MIQGRPRLQRSFRIAIASFTAVSLAACGTTYAVPKLEDADLSAARAQLAAERSGAGRAGVYTTFADARLLFDEVAMDVEPVAEDFCRDAAAEAEDYEIDCDMRFVFSTDPSVASGAFQTYVRDRPTLVVTADFIADNVANADELAFVLGHESAHHVSGHLAKRRQQEMVGAILLGALAAAAVGAGTPYGGYTPEQQRTNTATITLAAAAGGAVGGQAYSQTYELESDLVGAYVAALAGYDPERGARIFARLGATESETPTGSAAAFWATHPSSAERIALVDRVAAEIRDKRARGLPLQPARSE